MAIQIDEKHLSEEARRALGNAKSKSQLLRDALEYYVRRGADKSETRSDEQLANDVKDIKKLLLDMTNGVIPVTKIIEENSIDTEKEIFPKVKEIEKVEEKVEENTKETYKEDNDNAKVLNYKKKYQEDDVEIKRNRKEIPQCYDV